MSSMIHVLVRGNLRKLLLAVAALGLFLGFSPTASAEHGTEGTITVAGVEACSDPNDVQDSKCTWVSTDPGGWVGIGPFTITWVTDDPADEIGDDSFTCAANEYCSSTNMENDPIPVGATVTSDGHGPGGGTFAAGDADQHNGD